MDRDTDLVGRRPLTGHPGRGQRPPTGCRPLGRGAVCPWDCQEHPGQGGGQAGKRDSALGPSPCGPAGALLRKQAAGPGQSQQRCSVTGRTGQEPSGQPPRKSPGANSSTKGLGGRGGHGPVGGWGHTHTYIHKDRHTHTDTHAHTPTHTCTRVHRYTCICTEIHTSTQIHRGTHAHRHTHLYTQGQTHTHRYTHAHTLTHTLHMHTQIYTHSHT